MLTPSEWAGLVGLAVTLVGSIWGAAFFLATKLENHGVRIANLEKTVDRHEGLLSHAGAE